MEPPTCWLVLTIAEADARVARGRPRVAGVIDGATDHAEAEAQHEQAGQHVRRRSRLSGRAASAMTMRDRGRAMPSGTIRLRRRTAAPAHWSAICAATIIRAIIGRNARPVWTGE